MCGARREASFLPRFQRWSLPCAGEEHRAAEGSGAYQRLMGPRSTTVAYPAPNRTFFAAALRIPDAQ